ncbi:ADP-ribosylglycohydrolase family protein [Pelomyxa schiedti]|nr:ADP-ribosylglycohydrolase family protein [Pelomyxa schiedti]
MSATTAVSASNGTTTSSAVASADVTTSNRERGVGALVGLAVGDALGTTNEFQHPGSFSPLVDIVGGGCFKLLPGQFTDDTSMALCLAESIIELNGTCDITDQCRRYCEWNDHSHLSSNGRRFDIGSTCLTSIQKFQATGELASPEHKGQGNGSIMRLAPVPIAFSFNPQLAIAHAGSSSTATHGNIACVDACRYLAALIVGAINGATKEQLLDTTHIFVPDGVSPNYWSEKPLDPLIASIATGSYKVKEPPEIVARGKAHLTLEAALWGFYKTNSFREGCLLVSNLGDDADTVAAVYGQLAGAYYGLNGIPKEWRAKLVFSKLIEMWGSQLHSLSLLGRNPTDIQLQGDVSSGRDKCLLLKRALMLLEHGYQSVYHRLAPGPGPPCIWDKGYKSLLDMDLHVGREMSTPFSQLLASSGVTLIPPSLTSNTGLPKSVAPLLKKALPVAPASSSASSEPPTTTTVATTTTTTGTGAQTASDGELSEALVGLITGYLQQIASDREALQRCFERRPAVDAMLGQIRSKRPSGDS